MSDEKTTNLSSITGANLADNDLVMVVDVSDTTMAATGTNKKVTLDEFAQDSTFSSRYVSKSTEDSVHIVGHGEMLVAFGSAVYQRIVTYYGSWALDAASTEALSFNTMLPQHWTTYHADIMTINTTAGSGDIRWTFHRSIVANGATMSGLNTSVTVAVGAQNTLTYHRVLTGASNTSGSGIFCYFERDAGQAADTFASDINVVGVVFTRAS